MKIKEKSYSLLIGLLGVLLLPTYAQAAVMTINNTQVNLATATCPDPAFSSCFTIGTSGTFGTGANAFTIGSTSPGGSPLFMISDANTNGGLVSVVVVTGLTATPQNPSSAGSTFNMTFTASGLTDPFPAGSINTLAVSADGTLSGALSTPATVSVGASAAGDYSGTVGTPVTPVGPPGSFGPLQAFFTPTFNCNPILLTLTVGCTAAEYTLQGTFTSVVSDTTATTLSMPSTVSWALANQAALFSNPSYRFAVPEPSPLLLLGVALFMLALFGRKRLVHSRR